MQEKPFTEGDVMMTVPRPEYPRPQFRRSEWVNLNGEWQFAFDDADVGLDRGWHNASAANLGSAECPFKQRITVPFCYQSKLSGIGDPLPHDVVWYARTFAPCPIQREHQRLVLNFGAVDYWTTVWVNGIQVVQHEGGHTPFSADITHALLPEHNLVVVRAEDRSSDATIPRGKQRWKQGDTFRDIFYTCSTGIWQTVWMEPVDWRHIATTRITPDVDGGRVDIEVTVTGFQEGMSLRFSVAYEQEQMLQENVAPESACTAVVLQLAMNSEINYECSLWSPEHPNLYELQIELLASDSTVLDIVETYFGMRKIEARDGKVYLNGLPLLQRLVLDQGYFPDGLLTAPTDAALRRDIELAKEMGFDGARKHQKVEDPRWLYWADTLGFLVWGEMANAYEYSLDYVRRVTIEWQEVIRRDYNHPCIIVWVPINESSGGRRRASDPLQVEHLLAMYHLTRSLDATRLVVSNDGWEIVTSDLCTIHDYSDDLSLARRFQTLESGIAADPERPVVHYQGHSYRGEPILITEFGGITLVDNGASGWGYTRVPDSETFLEHYYNMIAALVNSEIVQGFCYTQLTDVEQELNGLLTHDRRSKVDVAKIREITKLTRNSVDARLPR